MMDLAVIVILVTMEQIFPTICSSDEYLSHHFYHALLVGMNIFPPGMNVCPKGKIFSMFYGKLIISYSFTRVIEGVIV